VTCNPGCQLYSGERLPFRVDALVIAVNYSQRWGCYRPTLLLCTFLW